MSQTADFLVEIGTEELPPKALRRLEQAFADALMAGIEASGLTHSGHRCFASPRRLAVLVESLQTEQPAREVEKRGPPVKVAFDANGQPTRAAEAFASGCGVTVDALDRVSTDKGEWLYFRGTEPGQPASALLPEMVRRALAELPIPKRMRWGAGETEFVRPVHWVLMMHGDQCVPGEILGQPTGLQTRGHRFLAPDPIAVTRPADYATLLEQQGRVVVDFGDRLQRIRTLAEDAAAKLGGVAVLETAVLEEVTALVEWPVALTGRFDQQFLSLPEEVLIATLQDHQRYFPVRDPAGKLLPHFITISNLDSKDPAKVQAGNERVVRPRLADAAFFWEQDCKQSLADRRDSLRDVVFQKDLGSLFDKSARVAELAHALAGELLHEDHFDQTVFQQWVVRAAHLAKTDLVTAMVGEFPELQGRMGYYYALNDHEPPAVAAAMEEQYLPRHAGDRLPADSTGRALAVADRLDTLAGIFAVGKKPTGNKDPFGLRRSALGLLRILIESDVDIDLDHYLGVALRAQPATPPATVHAELFAFVMDRLKSYYLDGQSPDFPAGSVTPEMFDAVRARNPVSPLDFHQRLKALRSFLALDAADSLAVANKRIANILRSATEQSLPEIDPLRFTESAEQELHEAVNAIRAAHEQKLGERDYASALVALAGLRAPVDRYFDAVMVMAEDADLRRNRLAFLQMLRGLFLEIADLSLIPAG